MDRPIIIGIAGGSASGKSSISQELAEHYANTRSVVIIKLDDYYKNQSHMPFSERVKTNYDHPFAFDMELMVQQIDDLASGRKIEKPTYDFVNHTRSDIVEVIEPTQVILLEGLFILEEEAIRNRCDIKIFVDEDADVRFIRRLKRDVEERGRTIDSVCTQYLNTVKPMHNIFIEPSKKYADIIVPEGAYNRVAMDLLLTKINSIIYKQEKQ